MWYRLTSFQAFALMTELLERDALNERYCRERAGLSVAWGLAAGKRDIRLRCMLWIFMCLICRVNSTFILHVLVVIVPFLYLSILRLIPAVHRL